MGPPTWIMAAEPVDTGDWPVRVSNAFRRAGFTGVVRRRGTVLAWKTTRSAGSIRAADSVQVSRLWLGPRRAGLAVVSRRVYVEGDVRVIDRPEREIIGNPPQQLDPGEKVVQQVEALELLRANGGVSARMVPVEQVPVDHPRIAIGGSTIPVAPELDPLYRRHGYDFVPEGWTVSVCPVDDVSITAAHRAETALLEAAARRRANVRVKVVSGDQVVRHLAAINRGEAEPDPGTVLFFIMPSPDEGPSGRLASVFESLDRLGVQYRRAYESDDLRFSVPTQLPSLLQAVGGVPHRIAIVRTGPRVWSVGLDLAHPKGQDTSVLAASLVHPSGHLLWSWRCRHPRDENMNAALLKEPLAHVSRLISERAEVGDAVVVLRDGRVLERESADTYLDPFDLPASLIEVRKNDNPQVMQGSTPTSAPSAVRVAGESTIFTVLSPPRSRNHLPAVRKATWQEAHNSAKLTHRQIAQLLVDLTAAPSLGTKAYSLPSPLYWADGIAEVTDHDLRFRGLGTMSADQTA